EAFERKLHYELPSLSPRPSHPLRLLSRRETHAAASRPPPLPSRSSLARREAEREAAGAAAGEAEAPLSHVGSPRTCRAGTHKGPRLQDGPGPSRSEPRIPGAGGGPANSEEPEPLSRRSDPRTARHSRLASGGPAPRRAVRATSAARAARPR